jgi:hypothetical protein
MQTSPLLLVAVLAGGVALGATDVFTTTSATAAARDEASAAAQAPRATVVVAAPDSLLTDDGLAALHALTQALQRLDGLERVSGPTTLRRPRRLRSGAVAWTTLPRHLPTAPLARSAWRARVLRDPLLVPRALSKDGRRARLELAPTEEVAAHLLWPAVRAAVASTPLPPGVTATVVVDTDASGAPLSSLLPTVQAWGTPAVGLGGVGLLLLVLLCTRSSRRAAACMAMAALPALVQLPAVLDDPALGDLTLLAFPSALAWALAVVVTAPSPRAPGLTFATQDSLTARLLRPGVRAALVGALGLVVSLATLDRTGLLDAHPRTDALVTLSLWVVLAAAGLAALWPARRVPVSLVVRPTGRLRPLAARVAVSLVLLAPVIGLAAAGRAPDLTRVSSASTTTGLHVTLEGPPGWLEDPGVLQRLVALEGGDALPEDVVVTTGPGRVLARLSAALAELPEGRLAPLPDEPDAIRALWTLAEDHPDLPDLVGGRRQVVRWRLDTGARSDAQLLQLAASLREVLLAPSMWAGAPPPVRVVVEGPRLAAAGRTAAGRQVALAWGAGLALVLGLLLLVVERALRVRPARVLFGGAPVLAAAGWDVLAPSDAWTLVVVVTGVVTLAATVVWREEGLRRQLVQQGLSSRLAHSSTTTPRLVVDATLPLLAVSTTVALIATPTAASVGALAVSLAAAGVAVSGGPGRAVASATASDRPQT